MYHIWHSWPPSSQVCGLGFQSMFRVQGIGFTGHMIPSLRSQAHNYTNKYKHAYTHARTHTHMHVHVQTHACTYTHVLTLTAQTHKTRKHIERLGLVTSHLHIRTRARTRARTRTHTHTHAHTLTHAQWTRGMSHVTYMHKHIYTISQFLHRRYNMHIDVVYMCKYI